MGTKYISLFHSCLEKRKFVRSYKWFFKVKYVTTSSQGKRTAFLTSCVYVSRVHSDLFGRGFAFLKVVVPSYDVAHNTYARLKVKL